MMHLDFSRFQADVLYHILMTLAVLVPFAFAGFAGIKKGFPAATWLTVLGLLFGLSMIGARLGAFSSGEWAALFHRGTWQEEAPKTVVWSAILFILGYQVFKKWFKLPASAADLLVLGMPLGAILGRMGCLSAGCCYGVPTDGWWSVTFGPASSAFAAQATCGKIGAGAVSSLPLHPVQLDILLSNVLIFSVLYFFRKKFRPGNLALAGLALIALTRFGSEFFRDFATNRGATGSLFLGLKLVQWLALIVAGSCFGIFLSQKNRDARPERPFQEQPFWLLAALTLPISILLWAFRLRLGLLETAVFSFIFTPVTVVLLVEIFKKEREQWVKWPSVAIVSSAVAIQLVAQTDSIIGAKPLVETTKQPTKNWWEFGGGYAYQRYHDYASTTTGSGCDAQTTVHRDREIVSKSAMFEGSIHSLDGGIHYSAGARLGVGRGKTTSGFPDDTGTFSLGGVFGSIDGRFIGASGGLLYVPERAGEILGEPLSSSRMRITAGLRLGSAKKYSFDFQLRERQQFLMYPRPYFTVGLINWGFNDPTGQSWLRLGIGLNSLEESSIIFAGFRTPLLQRKMTLEAGYYFTANERSYMFSTGLKYVLPAK